MAIQSCHQNPGTTAAPHVLRRWLTAAIGALVVVLAALPIVMSLDTEGTRASILREKPDLAGSDLDFATNAVLVAAAAVHALYAVAAIWLARKVLRGRRWARIALTVLMVLASINSLYSAEAGPEYYVWVIAGDLLHVAVLALLWIPRPVRDFFAAQRRAAKSPALP